MRFVVVLTIYSSICNAQNPKWYLGGTNILDTETNIAVGIVNEQGVSNAYFDNTGNLMFGISYASYDTNAIPENKVILGIAGYINNDELPIFPAPKECNVYYTFSADIILGIEKQPSMRSGGWYISMHKLYYNENTGKTIEHSSEIIENMGQFALAIGHEKNEQRTIYLAGDFSYHDGRIWRSGIKRIVVGKIGIQSISDLEAEYTSSGNISELELATDQNFLSWSVGNTLYLYSLTTNPTLYQYQTSGQVKGVEFDKNSNKIYYTGDSPIGIYEITYNSTGFTSAPSMLSNSSNYGNSHIEQALNGDMYVLQGNGTHETNSIGYFTPNQSNPNVTNITIPNMIKPYRSDGFYPLIDQIDGEDYGDYTPGCIANKYFDDSGIVMSSDVSASNGIYFSGNTSITPETGTIYTHQAGLEIVFKPGVQIKDNFVAQIKSCEKTCETQIQVRKKSNTQIYKNQYNQSVIVEIYNLSGIKLFEKKEKLNSSDKEQFRNGIYIIKEIMDTGIIRIRKEIFRSN